jgi:hypothetical protein
MKALSVIADGFSRWIDSVAGTVMTLRLVAGAAAGH